MGQSLFLLFNHSITGPQKEDARARLGVERILDLPGDLKALWSQIPADISSLGPYLEPLMRWLEQKAEKGDYVLIQGDFGACYIMVNFAFDRGMVPVYSTTKREAVEETGKDGSIHMTHRFRHVVFRKYGE